MNKQIDRYTDRYMQTDAYSQMTDKQINRKKEDKLTDRNMITYTAMNRQTDR